MSTSLIISIRDKLVLSLILISISVSAVAGTLNDFISSISQDWAEIYYSEGSSEQKSQKYAGLVEVVSEVEAKSAPNIPEIKVWKGILLSCQAKEEGGLSGLALAKKSRDLLESVVSKTPFVLHSSALTSLATLYYKVPSWPVGFRDVDKANVLFNRALVRDSDNIDVLFLYAQFLEESNKAEAATYYNKVLELPLSEGVRGQIESLRKQEARKQLNVLK